MHVITCCVIGYLQYKRIVFVQCCLQQVKKVKTFGKMTEDIKCLSKEKKHKTKT